MRIVIDMQGAQTDSRFRGIGRYTIAFAKAVVRNRGEHEIILVLNGLFPDTISPIRAAFDDLLDQKNILVWYAPGPTKDCMVGNETQRKIAELMREAFMANLQPDIIHITSMFEGYVHDAVTSIGRFDIITPVSVTIYDLIPLVNAKDYLATNPPFERHYQRKIEDIKKAKHYLSISEFSRQEAIEHLGVSKEACVNVSTALDDHFQPIQVTEAQTVYLQRKFNLVRPFLLCAGGADPRKNLTRLVQAYANLPIALRSSYQFLFVGKMLDIEVKNLELYARSAGLKLDELVFAGYVSDEELLQLYNLCELYVFPSWHEGFGLPALEAMACGVPVITSNVSSLPEVVGLDAAMFDPYDVESITRKIAQALEDDAFKKMLCEHGLQQSKLFSWNDTAKRAIAAWEDGTIGLSEEHNTAHQVSNRALNDICGAKLSDSLSVHSANNLTDNSTDLWRTSIDRYHGLYKKLLEKIATITKLEINDFLLQHIVIDMVENEHQIFKQLRHCYVLPHNLTWRLEGPFDSNYSLALVNREIARALAKQGHQVILHSTDGPADFEPNSQFLSDNPELSVMHKRAASVASVDADVTSRNLYPPRVSNMQSPFNVLHAYGWEESGFPLDWVDEFNQNLQGMTVMSNHVQKIMVDHGVTVPIAVSSLGVDHWQRVVPDNQYVIKAKTFRFLHVSSCFPRKGADVMLRAYGRAFRATDDVTLVIKTFANPHNDIHKWLNESRADDASFPDVQIIEDDLSDSQLKSLYEQCQALVAPSRAEGFGLPMAEAMLSGLAVITTGWGGQTDFCNEETAWLINYQFARARSHFGLFASSWAEPNEQHLTELMQEVYQTPKEERHVRVEAGQKLLVDQFCWSDAARRIVQAVRQWPVESTMVNARVAWVTTWNTKCGIASYSEHLIKNMSPDITILAAHSSMLVAPDDSNVKRCWVAGETDTFEDLSKAIAESQCNTIVIQFNYGFYNLEKFSKFIDEQNSLGRKVVLAMHATCDPPQVPYKKLSILADSLKRCQRVLVHSTDDLNRLKNLGVNHNVTLFPLGVLDNDFSIQPRKHLSPTFTIATYGFFLPHKGLLEIIDAVSLLRLKGMNVELILVNAEYPVLESKELIKKAQSKITELGLDDVVTLCTDFLTDEESLKKLSSADLVVFPYQETAESASAAVRFGIVSEVPVAVTPLQIFNDVSEATFTLPGFTLNGLAQGIYDITQSIRANDQQAQNIKLQATAWKEQHLFSKLGNRLSNMLNVLSR
jgi:glycosyltransferase involved in cell wall biosynthesis